MASFIKLEEFKDLFKVASILQTNSTNTTSVPQAQVIGEVSVAAVQMVSFIVLLPVILILLCCFTRQKKQMVPNYSRASTLDGKNQQDLTEKKGNYSKNKVILFSILLPSVIILIIVFGLRILNMAAFPVDTFVSAQKPLNVRVINALVYCGWSLNDWWLVVQFLFVGYIFLETSKKLRYISDRVYKLILGLIFATPIVLGVVIVGYCVTVLVDQITKSETTNPSSQAAIIFFYSLSTVIFIGCVLSSLGYMIWTTVRLVRHLKSSSENSGEFLQKTTNKAIRRIIIIVTLVALIAVFLCIMELISFVGEISNVSVYFQVISLVGKALATWIFIVGLCILFGPLSEMKKLVKNVMKNVNSTVENPIVSQKKRISLKDNLTYSPSGANSVSTLEIESVGESIPTPSSGFEIQAPQQAEEDTLQQEKHQQQETQLDDIQK